MFKWLPKKKKIIQNSKEIACQKCGKTPIYIVCPDHCYECFLQEEPINKINTV